MIHLVTGKYIGKHIKTVFLFTFLFIIYPTSAQIYPVQANINVTPPYTVYLSHYTSPDQQRIMVNLLLHDPIVTSVDVRFRFTLEGGGIRLYTNPGWISQPYTLMNGISTLLSGDIISDYFQPQHLIVEGTNSQDFFRSGKLPEGFYQFKVEVLEYQRGVTISNTALTGVWLLLNEAPRLVFPVVNQKVNATNPQMLNFSWIPGGITSPLSAQSTMYEFTMVELNGDIDPTVAITTASDAIKYTRILQQTSLFYGPGEPQLILGKKYAVRVRAYNTEGYELFKNNGYSEVRVFQFGDACSPPILFNLNDETQSTFSISVQTDISNTAWQAQFRESGDDNDTWSELKAESGVTDKTVKGLKASTTYEVQVKAICGSFTSDFSQTQTITTTQKVNSQNNCENTTSPFVVTQSGPLDQLKVNDFFIAALVPIKVTEVTKQGGGKFSGSGIASLPLFNAGLAVTFEDIGINDLMQLTSGEVTVVRNEVNINLFGDDLPTDGTSGSDTSTDTISGGTWPTFTDTITIDVPFDSVLVVNDSTIWVIPTGGGEPIVVDLGGSTCTLVVPASGNMDDAKVVYNGAAQPYSARSGNETDGEQEKFTGFLANFFAAANQQYGFDSSRHDAHVNYYNEMEVNGKLIRLPWKALASGQIDPVNLKIRRSADTYPYSNLKISILGGTDLQPVVGANTASQTYSLTGATDGDETPIVATFTEDGKTKYAGGIWTATYQPQSFKLFIVPFPKVDISEGEIGQLQNGLNQIYSQAVVSWDVKPMNGFTGIDLGDNGLDWVESDMLSSYDSEMNSVISAFKNWKENPDPDAYYLFIVPKFSESNVEGYMPRNRRFGFVTLSQLDARLVAHEIGHGAFNLRHTFPEATQGSTDNLMDYTQDKYSLLKAQWDLIHNPETTTGLFDDMGDGAMSVFNSKLSLVYYNDSGLVNKQCLYFLPEMNEKVTLTAKYKKENKLEDVKVNWKFNDSEQKEITGINFTADSSFYGNKDSVQMDVTEKVLLGPDSTLTYFISKVDISSAFIIDSVLTGIRNIKQEFDSLVFKIPSLLDPNMDSIALLTTSKYVTRGLSDYYEAPSNADTLTDFDKTLVRMYNLDLQINEIEERIGNIDKLSEEIDTIYSDEQTRKDFFNLVVKNLKTINPKEKKNLLEVKYRKQLIELTLNKLLERINSEQP